MSTPTTAAPTRALADQLIVVVEDVRTTAGLSVAELARRMGVQQTTLARQLHGRGDLTIDEWTALADALAITLPQLLDAARDGAALPG